MAHSQMEPSAASLADQIHGRLTTLDGSYASQPAGEHHHVAGRQRHIRRHRIRRHRDAMRTHHRPAVQPCGGHLHSAPAEHISHTQGLHFLEALAQKDVYHMNDLLHRFHGNYARNSSNNSMTSRWMSSTLRAMPPGAQSTRRQP